MNTTPGRGGFFAVLLGAALVAGSGLPAMAAGGGSSTPSASTSADPNYAEGRKAIEAKDWRRAVDLMNTVVARDAGNADAFNWLGFAYRKLADYDAAFKYYGRALAIDPKHRGAHEYIGEAYLQIGDLAKAEEHLKALDGICFFGCKEYTELKDKVAAFRAGKTS